MNIEAYTTLNQIALDVFGRHDLDKLLQAVVAHATELLDVPYGEVMLLEGDLLVVHSFTPNQSFLVGDRVGQSEALLSWQAVASRRPAVLDNYSEWQKKREIYDNQSYFATADFPILSGDRCLGVLAVARDKPDYVFDSQDILLGSLFAELVALALDNTQLYVATQAELKKLKQAEAANREQALRDQLTGLYNRWYLDEILRQEFHRASREGYTISVVMIDIDHFKKLNDTNGHAAGDKVLQALGAHFQTITRAGDIVCRYGGDEFLVVLSRTSAQVAKEWAERWRRSLEEMQVSYKGRRLQFTVSVGIAESSQGEWMDAVILAADQALYRAKATGRNCIGE